MPRIMKVSLLGQSILREKAKPVLNVNDPVIQKLIDNMIKTFEKRKGVGIAAPQVDKPYRLFIISSQPSLRCPDIPVIKPIAIINPVIKSVSYEMEKDWESCLSIPGIRGLVSRHKSLTVTFTNRNGQMEEMFFEGFIARVFQHEYDHIEGIVYLDRADPLDLVMEEVYQNNVNAKK